MGAAITGQATASTATTFDVQRSNADALDAWLACDTQWRVAATMAGMIWLGLDYAGVDVVLRRSKFADPDAVFRDLQVMEGEALRVFAKDG